MNEDGRAAAFFGCCSEAEGVKEACFTVPTEEYQDKGPVRKA
jgi:hypothetical protein